jgi:hypothetical protein
MINRFLYLIIKNRFQLIQNLNTIDIIFKLLQISLFLLNNDDMSGSLKPHEPK